jgi:asparagine synthase (glutamine-hydrolysing)
VVLSGDGSDELFAGYERRYTADTRRLWPGQLARAVLSAEATDRIWHNRAWVARLRRKAHLAALPPLDRYITSYTWFSTPEKRVLLQPEIVRALDTRYGPEVERWFPPGEADPLKGKLRYEFHTTLADEMLTKMDRATSSASIEGRVPFLDRRLAEAAWAIPPRRHWRRGCGKLILKSLARELLPEAIINRPKTGFVVPLDRWLREDETFLRPVLREPCPAFDAVIRPRAVSAMLEAHAGGSGVHGERLWTLYVLKQWMQLNASPPTR